MNRFLAAALLCIMQLCYAHCFAEQMGLLGVDAPQCCAANGDDTLPVKNKCVVCDMMHTGVIVESSSFKCISINPALVPDVPMNFVHVERLATIECKIKTADHDVSRPPANVWVALVRTAHPVRGPSVI